MFSVHPYRSLDTLPWTVYTAVVLCYVILFTHRRTCICFFQTYGTINKKGVGIHLQKGTTFNVIQIRVYLYMLHEATKAAVCVCRVCFFTIILSGFYFQHYMRICTEILAKTTKSIDISFVIRVYGSRRDYDRHRCSHAS